MSSGTRCGRRSRKQHGYMSGTQSIRREIMPLIGAGSFAMEIFVFARLHARPGKRDDVHQAMFAVQGPTREEAGCLA